MLNWMQPYGARVYGGRGLSSGNARRSVNPATVRRSEHVSSLRCCTLWLRTLLSRASPRSMQRPAMADLLGRRCEPVLTRRDQNQRDARSAKLEGFEVVVAGSSQEALQTSRRRSPQARRGAHRPDDAPERPQRARARARRCAAALPQRCACVLASAYHLSARAGRARRLRRASSGFVPRALLA